MSSVQRAGELLRGASSLAENSRVCMEKKSPLLRTMASTATATPRSLSGDPFNRWPWASIRGRQNCELSGRKFFTLEEAGGMSECSKEPGATWRPKTQRVILLGRRFAWHHEQ